MDDKTRGAWVIHHARKLDHVTNSIDYEGILTAGKAGILLSGLSADDQVSLSMDRVDAIRKAANISRTELPELLRQLEQARLIEQGTGGVDVLGVTSQTVLERTAEIYANQEPSQRENAAIDFAEATSQIPLEYDQAVDQLSDEFQITSDEAGEVVNQSETIGFVDGENIDEKRKLYFNGNIFRRENAKKMEAVFTSLKDQDIQDFREVDTLLRQNGALTVDRARHILGLSFDKLHAAGIFDVSEVSNDKETVLYVTRPSAFGKFGNPFADDALDLAKAFVTCLTYGMTRRTADRGRIKMVRALLRKLINGQSVGPATAIGQDYRVLEMNRVIELTPATGNLYYMRLLKREVGVLALEVVSIGDASESTLQLAGAPVSRFVPPEHNRVQKRRVQNKQSKKATLDIITTLRTRKR